MKRTLTFILAFVMLIGMLPGYVFATEQQGTRSTASPYLQQLPDSFTGCSNLYNLLAPVKGYYTASKYDTSNGSVLSVVIPVEPGDRIAASSFGPKSENMGSVDGIRVTFLLGDTIVTSMSAGDVYSGYMSNGYITVPEGVDAVCVPWWAPSTSNWMTLAQKSKNYASHSPKSVSAQAATCTQAGFTEGTRCEVCDLVVDGCQEIPKKDHNYENNVCTYCGLPKNGSPYLQSLPSEFLSCENLYTILTPKQGYYNSKEYLKEYQSVVSVVIPVEPGDRIAANSFGPMSENKGSVDGIRVTFLSGNTIVTSMSAGDVHNGYMKNGYITVPEGVDAVCVPWWTPDINNWLTLAQKSKNYAAHSPKTVPEQLPTCTENGYTAGEICEFCNVPLDSRKEIPATGHKYVGKICSICGSENFLASLAGKYVSILGDSISTFKGYSNNSTVNSTIGGNGPRYDTGTADTKPGSYCLLNSVNDTWWMHFANRSGMNLLVNNSWAGSQVFGGQTSDGRKIPAAYLDRCVNLHDNSTGNNPNNAPINPDVIFVYLGINDYNFNRSNVGNGAVDYSKLIDNNGAYITPTNFGEAYGIMLHKMLAAYPNAQIFVMTLLPENLYSVDKTAWEQHNAYIRAAAAYYGIPVVDLAKNCAITWSNYSSYMIDKIHPTTAGMKLISDCIEAELISYYKAGPTHAHRYETTWRADNSGHWHECSVCHAKKDTAAHTPGAAATSSTAQTCTVCGYIITPVLGHTHSYANTWTTDEKGHWYACPGCEEKSSYAEHNFENACDMDCSICGYKREIQHAYTEKWENNATDHWHACSVCGVKAEEAAHVPGAAATTESAQTCTVCGYEIAPKVGTTGTEPNDGTAETQPVTDKDPAESEFDWTIIAIVAIAVVAGSIIFIVLKKKQ